MYLIRTFSYLIKKIDTNPCLSLLYLSFFFTGFIQQREGVVHPTLLKRLGIQGWWGRGDIGGIKSELWLWWFRKFSGWRRDKQWMKSCSRRKKEILSQG
jgi:hypothetical protein